MQEELHGGVTENVGGNVKARQRASGCYTLELFTQYLIKLCYEGISHP